MNARIKLNPANNELMQKVNFKMAFTIIFICFNIMLSSNINANTIKNSNAIKVDVKANRNLTTTQKIISHTKNSQLLDISLTNNGTHELNIDSIIIRIPSKANIDPATKLAFGSSCMGQRFLLIHEAKEKQKNSYSYMFAMAQISNKKYTLVGALSWRVFIPKISIEGNDYVIRSSGEGKLIKPGETIKYEKIIISSGNNWNNILNDYGWAIAKENDIKQVKDVHFKGWGTWDYYARRFSDKDIYENMNILQKIDPTANLIQIDAGWYTQRGDFTQSRTDLPGGMKAIADSIKAAGMIPGIWIDGFRANRDSEVFKNHPEYFLHDNEGNLIVQVRKAEGDEDRDRVYVDFSHPGARAHFAEVMRAITYDMGIPYVKIDFVRFGLNDEIFAANKETKSIKPYDPSMTDVERVRIGLQTMRDASAPGTYILGCSGVFGPMIGLVDGMRTGGDIYPYYEAFSERVLANAGNYYLNSKVFNADADYLVFRAAADEDETVAEEKAKNGGTLTVNESQMWGDFTKFYGNFKISSDKLLTLRPERQAILKDVLDFPLLDQMTPLDFWQHGQHKKDGFELLLGISGKDIYIGIFNWTDKPKEYKLKAFGAGPQILSARTSKIIKYTGKLSFDKLQNKLIQEINQ